MKLAIPVLCLSLLTFTMHLWALWLKLWTLIAMNSVSVHKLRKVDLKTCQICFFYLFMDSIS